MEAQRRVPEVPPLPLPNLQLTLGQEIRQEIRGTETPMGEGSPNGADAFVRPDPTAIPRRQRGGAT